MKLKLVRLIWLSRTSIWRRVSFSSFSMPDILFKHQLGKFKMVKLSSAFQIIFKIKMSITSIEITFRVNKSIIKILLNRFWINLFPSLEALEHLDLVIRLVNKFKLSKASISKNTRRNECNESLWYLKINLRKLNKLKKLRKSKKNINMLMRLGKVSIIRTLSNRKTKGICLVELETCLYKSKTRPQ